MKYITYIGIVPYSAQYDKKSVHPAAIEYVKRVLLSVGQNYFRYT